MEKTLEQAEMLKKEREQGERRNREVQSVGVLCIESNFYSLNLVTQFDGWTKLQLHAFLHRWQCQQQKGLAIDVLGKKKTGEMVLFVDSGAQKA